MRVLELAQIMAGPTCGMMLADLGADVIKVEKLPGGDDARGYREPRVNGVSAPFLMMNRNKRGIALDLKIPQGREICCGSSRRADVLIENYRRGTMEQARPGLRGARARKSGAHLLRGLRLRTRRPLADQGGFDLVAQGFAGLMRITGEPGRPPVKSGNPVADINAGLLGAHRHRRRVRASAEDRAGPARRHVARAKPASAADVLARGDRSSRPAKSPGRSAPRTC